MPDVSFLRILCDREGEGAMDSCYKLYTWINHTLLMLLLQIFWKMSQISDYFKGNFKVAERCMLNCLTKFPLHKLRGTNAPFIKRSSEFNRWVRVYVNAASKDVSDKDVKEQLSDLEDMLG